MLYVDIEKTFPDFRLAARFEGENEVVALLGESGCGKSLTLRCIAGIETPDKGRIVINGKTVFDSEQSINIPPQKRRVGYLFQNYALFPTMTVQNNIASVVRKPKDERAAITQEIIELFKLDAVKDLYPRQISGGQQQRTALARILVSEPEILLLDEPFSALDAHLKWRVEQEILSVLSTFHGTTVFVSHDRNETYRLSDKIAVMNNGAIELTGAKDAVFSSPKTLAAALITGCKNISAAEKIDEFRVSALDWGVTLRTETPVPDTVKHIGVRAHHFKTTAAVSNDDNTFSCYAHRVVEEPFEEIIEFSFDTSASVSARLHFAIPKESADEHISDEFFVYVPPDKIMCLDG